jgi:hypothetical protein
MGRGMEVRLGERWRGGKRRRRVGVVKDIIFDVNIGERCMGIPGSGVMVSILSQKKTQKLKFIVL